MPEEDYAVRQLEKFAGHDIKPSLLHGDLWAGNFLISDDGVPYLIDPAVFYGHFEVDLAMTRLFGGFSTHFYSAYGEVNGDAKQKIRCELYQLYYLLVHLNMFGLSYQQACLAITKKYLAKT